MFSLGDDMSLSAAKNAAEQLRGALDEAREALDSLEEAMCDAEEAGLEVEWEGAVPDPDCMKDNLVIQSIVFKQEL